MGGIPVGGSGEEHVQDRSSNRHIIGVFFPGDYGSGSLVWSTSHEDDGEHRSPLLSSR